MKTKNDNAGRDGVRSIDCSEFPSFMWSDFAATGWQIGRTAEETINCRRTISRGIGKRYVYFPNDKVSGPMPPEEKL